jgi:ankyrin repeat protein
MGNLTGRDEGKSLAFKNMKTIIALLLASRVVSLAQTTADNFALDATQQLLNAVNSNDVETVKSLLNKGVDVNTKVNGVDNDTVLMSAVQLGHPDAVKLLLDRGADVNAKDNEGFTALMFGYSPPLDFSTVSSGLRRPLTTDEQIDEMKIAKLLLDKGADINAKDNTYGDTALIHLALDGFTNAVLLLQDRGADINAKDNNGDTALSCAVIANETNTVKFLLLMGGDINAVNKAGETALGIARRIGNMAVVRLLQQAGATASSASESSFNPVVASGTNTDRSGNVTNAALLIPFTLTNSAGNVITNAVLVQLTPNKFIYKTAVGGMGMLPLASLPEDLRKKFGYDLQAAQAADETDQRKKARQQQYAQQQREFAAQQASVKPQSQSAVSDTSRSIRAFAEKEFPDNYSMQEFVIKQQTEAYDWLVTASSATGVPQEVFEKIKTKAADEFPDNFEMQKFVINQQVKAYTNLH